MCDAPALRDVEAQCVSELFCCLTGYRVAPCAEFSELLSVLVEGQVAVHHCRDTDAADPSKSYAEPGLNVSLQCCIACLKTLMDHVGRICPDAVNELVLPFEIA